MNSRGDRCVHLGMGKGGGPGWGVWIAALLAFAAAVALPATARRVRQLDVTVETNWSGRSTSAHGRPKLGRVEDGRGDLRLPVALLSLLRTAPQSGLP